MWLTGGTDNSICIKEERKKKLQRNKSRISGTVFIIQSSCLSPPAECSSPHLVNVVHLYMVCPFHIRARCMCILKRNVAAWNRTMANDELCFRSHYPATVVANAIVQKLHPLNKTREVGASSEFINHSSQGSFLFQLLLY